MYQNNIILSVDEFNAAADSIYNYAVDKRNSLSVETMSLIKMVMGDKKNTAVFREKIIAKAMNYDHSNHLHGYDAYDNNRKKSIEIKTEQADILQNADRLRHQQLNGEGAFSGIVNNAQITEKFVKEKFFINHGFFWNGKLLAIFEFPSTHSGIVCGVRRYATKKEQGSKGAVKYVGGDWMCSGKVVCRWLNKELILDAINNGYLKPGTQTFNLMTRWIKFLEKELAANTNLIIDKHIIHYPPKFTSF